MIAARVEYLEAIVDLSYERGYESLTVEEIAARAGGDAAELERIFGSKEACAVAALEHLAADNMRVVREAFESQPSWPASLRAAAYAHARWIVDHPRKTYFGMMEALWAGGLTGAVRDRLITQYVGMIEAGREVAADPDAVPSLAAESVVGSIAQVMSRHSDALAERDPTAFVPEMMYLAVRPYLGEEVARRELTMPPP